MQTVYVNVDCANIYKENSYRSAIVSQAILWEHIAIKKKDNQFSLVICEDGYLGWISNHQISSSVVEHDREVISSNHAYIFNEANENSMIIREAGAGSHIPVIQRTAGWYQVVLPDGPLGWIREEAFVRISGDPKSNLLRLAPRFLGVPYVWGGKTAKGLDCSGFNQLLHKLVGIKIRRDSPMQCEDARMVSENFLDGTAGDLLFFAESGDRITHVAVKLNQKEIIHARGRVRINSLDKNAENFDKQLSDSFVAVKTFFKDE